MQIIQDIAIDTLMRLPVAEDLRQAMDTIATAQERILAFAGSDDGTKFKLVKMATVFQIFLIDTLASGKKMSELTKEDWESIALKVSQHKKYIVRLTICLMSIIMKYIMVRQLNSSKT